MTNAASVAGWRRTGPTNARTLNRYRVHVSPISSAPPEGPAARRLLRRRRLRLRSQLEEHLLEGRVRPGVGEAPQLRERPLRDRAAAMHDRDVVAEALRRIEHVRRHEDAGPLGGERTDVLL